MNRLALFLLIFLVPASYLANAEEARSFSRIDTVVSEWDGQQKLWVAGNIGVDPNSLTALESWLDVNAANWTIVLMQNARGQFYDGKTGMTAVEFALGEGLSNRTGFADLTDERTGEKNGAVFVLFLEERKFSYFASEIFDKRSLGERYWVGRLDAPAIGAMRNGGRIVDAVKLTTNNIQNKLSQKLEEEKQRARLAEIEKQRAIEEAKKYPAQIDQRIREAVKKGQALLQSSAGAGDGPVFSPDLAKWEANRDSIRKLVAVGSLQNARTRFAETEALISAYEAGLDTWAEAPERMENLAAQIERQPTTNKDPTIAGLLAKANTALLSARENHSNGEPLYLDQIIEAERSIDTAEARYSAWVEAEKRKRILILTLASVAAFLLLVFLIVANRLRVPARNRARELFQKWRGILDGKFDELFQLMDRAGVIVGSSSELKERGFTGTTEVLAKETIRDVDELFIMSSATDRVMERVEKLVEPGSFSGKLENFFSSRRYKKAAALLSSEPIGFDRKDHLEAILEPGSTTRNESGRTLLGESDDYEPFRISFEKLVEEYDARQAVAKEEVTRLEAGIDGLPLRQQALSEALSETGQLADALAARSAADTLFPLVSLRQKLIPEAAEMLENAARVGEADPVEAYESILPEASRLVTESRKIAETTESFRAIDLPVMQRVSESLTGRKRSSSWIDNALATATARCEQLAEQACEESVAEQWVDFDDSLTRLKGRAMRCEELAKQVQEKWLPAITAARASVKSTREELAAALKLPTEKVLHEPGLSPDTRVDNAIRGLEAAVVAIDGGEAITAERDIAEVESQLDESASMLELSRTCVENHDTLHRELSSERRTLIEEKPEAAALLEDLKSQYAPSVLTFHSRFGETIEDGQLTVVNSIERAERRLEISGRELDESRAAFASGKLIRAHSLLEAVANELGFARHQLALVRDQYEALREAEKENRKRAESVEQFLEELVQLAEDPRTIQSTITDLKLVGEWVLAFVESLEKQSPDPFLLFRDGKVVERDLRGIEDRIRGDWEAHELAKMAETSAEAALAFCRQFIKKAQTDKIPNSRALDRAIQRHGELTEELEQIEKTLESDHADWNELFTQTAEIEGETAKILGTLKEQLAAARDAAERIRSASRAISKLQRWRSSYSVSTNRKAGSHEFNQAEAALSNGNYKEARLLAVSSEGISKRELQRAKTRESREASKAAMSFSSSSTRSSWSSGSSFSSSSSSSGFSGSSFSSGSGFSRSGW